MVTFESLDEALQSAIRAYMQGLPNQAGHLLQGLKLKLGLSHLRSLHLMVATSMGQSSAVDVANHLIPLLASKESFLEASLLFCAVPEPTARAYHGMISLYAGIKDGAQSFDLYKRMQTEGIQPNEFTFPCILKVCGRNRTFDEAVLVHNQILCLGYESHAVIGDALIDMYTKCGCLEVARQVFKELPNRSLVSWSIVIGGCTQNGQGLLALELFEEMQQTQLQPDMVILSCILKACCTLGLLNQGKLIHDWMIQTELVLDVVAKNTLIDMYFKHGQLDDACNVFNKMTNRSLMSWGAMLDGYSENRQGARALAALVQMQKEGVSLDKVVYLCAVKACTSLQCLRHGRIIHNQVISNRLDSHVSIRNALIDMYAKCGELDEGYRILHSAEIQEAELWATMLNASLRSGLGSSGIKLLAMMQSRGVKPDQVFLSSVLKACGQTDALSEGRLVHHQIMYSCFDSEAVIGNNLVCMYAYCASLRDASEIFNKLQNRTVVSWSAMMAGYCQHGPSSSFHIKELFETMLRDSIKPDEYIYSCALKACAINCSLSDGKWVHSQLLSSGLEVDAVLGCTLVDMYGKCGELEEACRVFYDLQKKDIVSWGAMIAGCVTQGNNALAICLYDEMRRKAFEPNSFVLSSVLKACGLIGATFQGMVVHDHIIKHQLESDLFVESALIDLYVKCERMDEATKVRKSSQNQSIVSWGALISGYAQSAHAKVALECVDKLCLQGLTPNEAVYASALSACGHAGQVEKGYLCFRSMMENQGDTFNVKPYNCMADVYARAGYLKEASELLYSLPAPPDTFGWASLYSNSSVHAWQGVDTEVSVSP